MFKAGDLIGGKYVIERLLGEGGMGAVFVARHDVIGKRVAIKALHAEHSQDREIARRFVQEAKAASRVGHENIVDVIDIDETAAGTLYFVMELLEGESLAERLQREGRLPVEKAAEICGQVLLALRKAHASGIVHRDIKPENVFLTTVAGRRDFVKILDFGISKFNDPAATDPGGGGLTRAGMMLGTPNYMSPEQARGAAVDHRIDIYSTGVVLYEAVTGALPFEAPNTQALAFKIATEDPVPPSRPFPEIPRALEAVILKAMARDPGRRFASAEELFLRLVPFGARDYSGELAGGPGRASAPAHAAPLSPAPREAPSATSASSSTVLGMEKGRRRSRLPIIAGTVAATLLLAVSTILVTQRLPGGGEAKDAAPRAAAAQKAAAPVEKPQQPAAQQEKKAFVLTITAAPREAVIKLDGAPLAGNPARATLAGGEEHVVSAEAAGFEPQEKRVSLVKDADVSFDLVPTAPPPPAVEAKKKPAAQKAALPLAAPTPAPQEEKPGKKTLDEDWNDVAKGKGTKKAITEGWEEVGKPGPK